MCRFALPAAILFAIIATSLSRSIETESDEDVQGTGFAADSPEIDMSETLPDDSEPRPDDDPKWSLVILLPTTEDEDASTEKKTKRCESSTERDTYSKEILTPKKRSFESKSRPKGINLRGWDRKKSSERIVAKSNHLAAPAEASLPNYRLVEDDTSICYCTEKIVSPGATDRGTTFASNEPLLSSIRNASSRPGKGNPDSKGERPCTPRGRGKSIPFIPYSPKEEPSLSVSNAIPEEPSPKRDDPLGADNDSAETIVDASTVQQSRHEDGEPTAGTTPSPRDKSNRIPPRLSTRTTTESAAKAILAQSNPGYDEGSVDTSDCSELNDKDSVEIVESPDEGTEKDPRVGDRDPGSIEKSLTGAKNDIAGEQGRRNDEASPRNRLNDPTESIAVSLEDAGDVERFPSLHPIRQPPVEDSARASKGDENSLVSDGDPEDSDDSADLEDTSSAGTISEEMITSQTGQFDLVSDDGDPLLGKSLSAKNHATELPDPNTDSSGADYDKIDYDPEGSDCSSSEDKEMIALEHTMSVQSRSTDAAPIIKSPMDPIAGNDYVTARNPSDESLPFCDNNLLQKSIKAAINSFARGDLAEPSGKPIVSPMSEDLLPEIAGLPNLRDVVSVPMIERTILDKVKNLLSKVTGLPRGNFDSEWSTRVIRKNLHQALSAACGDHEISPATIAEPQPSDSEMSGASDEEKARNAVRNLLRHPAMDPQAAMNPAVRNMIVQSVRNIFEPQEGTGNKAVDDSLIISALNDELSNAEVSVGAATEIDPARILEIARVNAGVTDGDGNASRGKGDTVPRTTQSFNDNIWVGATRDLEVSEAADAPQRVRVEGMEPATSRAKGNRDDRKVVSTKPDVVGAAAENRNRYTTVQIPDYRYRSGVSTEVYPIGITVAGDARNREQLAGITNVPASPDPRVYEASFPRDFAYLGKIFAGNEDKIDGVQSLRNSELVYVGDGVQLPLEIRRLEDGTYVLAISRGICEHLTGRSCPCCVPPSGNVVRAANDNSGRIAKRELRKSTSPSGRRSGSSEDDSRALSMPVKSFARKYNLSLDAGRQRGSRKVLKKDRIEDTVDGRANENDEEEYSGNERAVRIGGRTREPISGIVERRTADSRKVRTKDDSYEKDDNEDEEEDETVYEKHRMANEGKYERYRFERNIDENMNRRTEIVINVLDWLRDMFFHKY